MRLAGLELGGTNANLVLGTPKEIVERCRLPVTDGPDTLARIAEQLVQWHQAQPIDALGIASFGPLQLDSGQADYGHVVATVKPGMVVNAAPSVVICRASSSRPLMIDTLSAVRDSG